MSRTPVDPTLLHPDTIERLAAIMRDQGLTELEIHDDKARLHLVRGPAIVAAPSAPAAPAAVVVNTAPAAAAPTAAALAAEAPPPAGTVKSPMVGIAYLAPEPGAAPYITLGATVAAGQTVLLIEAMKTFNQIKAPQAGTVTQILVATGSPVEYDQPLLVICLTCSKDPDRQPRRDRTPHPARVPRAGHPHRRRPFHRRHRRHARPPRR